MSQRADLRLIAALIHKGVLCPDEAEALADLYDTKADYDNPVPISVEAAFFQVGDIFDEIEDDEAIAGMLEPTDDDRDAFAPIRRLGRWKRFVLAGQTFRYVFHGG